MKKIFFKKNNKRNKGLTLVETLVAISIFTISILGMLSVIAKGISDTNYAKKKIVAEYLAQEGIEYVRNMRDTYVLYPGPSVDWNGFRAKLSSCKINPSDNECGFNTVFPHDFFKCNTHSNGCKLFIDTGNYNSNSIGADSGFVRKIWVDVIDQDKEIKISSMVLWTQGSGNYNITFSENLYNWIE